MKPCVNEYFTELKNYVSKTFGISLNPIPLRDKATFIISTQRYPDRISPHMVMNEDHAAVDTVAVVAVVITERLGISREQLCQCRVDGGMD